MKTTARFETAVSKLYTAYHANTLNPEYCQQCAVGTILDGTDAWKHLSDHHGSLHLNYVGKVHQTLGRRFNGYTPLELLRIEAAFLQGCGYQLPLLQHGFKPDNPANQNLLFDGLCSAIDILYRLDGFTEKTLDIEKLLSSEHRYPSATKQKIK